MKKFFILILGASLIIGCGKKDKEHATMKADGANPHAGMDMKDPHAGMPMPGAMDPHAGITRDPNAPTPTLPAPSDPTTLNAGKVTAKLPDGWKAVAPASSMRLAQVEIPAASGDPEPGEIAAFYFGPDAGGVEPNIQRWFDQFQQPDGKPTKDIAKREELKAGDMKVTVVSFTGSTAGASMPGAPSKGPREKWMNLSAIVETPDGPYFLKGTGPEKTMKAAEEEFKKFVQGLKYQ